MSPSAPLRLDIDASDDTHAFDGLEIRGVLVGHAAGTENKQTHEVLHGRWKRVAAVTRGAPLFQIANPDRSSRLAGVGNCHDPLLHVHA